MKAHNLLDKQKYPSFHVWATAKKLNVYSSVDINKGDSIDLNGQSMKVTEVKISRPNNDHHGKKVLFYEIDLEA